MDRPRPVSRMTVGMRRNMAEGSQLVMRIRTLSADAAKAADGAARLPRGIIATMTDRLPIAHGLVLADPAQPATHADLALSATLNKMEPLRKGSTAVLDARGEVPLPTNAGLRAPCRRLARVLKPTNNTFCCAADAAQVTP